MSEVVIFSLLGVMRAFLGFFLLEEWENLMKKKYIILSFLMSFVYSTIVVVIGFILFRPITLGIGLMIGDTNYFAIVLILLTLIYLFVLFWIELKNNLLCLEEQYPKEKIKRITIATHILSLIGIVIYGYMR